MIPDIKSFRLVPHMTNIIEFWKIQKFTMLQMGVAQKWHFSPSGGGANLGGVSGDLSEHRGSGTTFLGITSQNEHYFTGL